MKKLFMIAVLFPGLLSAAPVRAEGSTVSTSDLLKVIKADSVGRAALAQLKGCQLEVTKSPGQPYGDFQVVGRCYQKPNGYTGGGYYLIITIEGQYWDRGEGELKKVELTHAG